MAGCRVGFLGQEELATNAVPLGLSNPLEPGRRLMSNGRCWALSVLLFAASLTEPLFFSAPPQGEVYLRGGAARRAALLFASAFRSRGWRAGSGALKSAPDFGRVVAFRVSNSSLENKGEKEKKREKSKPGQIGQGLSGWAGAVAG